MTQIDGTHTTAAHYHTSSWIVCHSQSRQLSSTNPEYIAHNIDTVMQLDMCHKMQSVITGVMNFSAAYRDLFMACSWFVLDGS